MSLSDCSLLSLCRCSRCPRLVSYRQSIKGKGPLADKKYWNKPVPGFGDINATVLILGLAPGPHGANRTGRPFTGDAAGEMVYGALYDCGKSSSATGLSRQDGLTLTGIYITNTVKCVPPGNLPKAEEVCNCLNWFDLEIRKLKYVQTIMCLGGLAFEALKKHLIQVDSRYGVLKKTRFHNGVRIDPGGELYKIAGLYHPSRRNVNTGLVTYKSFSDSFKAICQDA